MDAEKAELQDYLEVLEAHGEGSSLPWFYDKLYLMKIRDICI